MAEKTVKSGRFRFEIDTGKKTTTGTFRGESNVTASTAPKPVVVKFPPGINFGPFGDSYITESTYTVDDKGNAGAASVKLIEEINKSQFDKLPEDLRKSEVISRTLAKGETAPLLIYFAIVATRENTSRQFNETAAVDILYDKTNADLFKKEIGKFNSGAGKLTAFHTVESVANKSIIKEEKLKDVDVRNETGLGKNIPSSLEQNSNTNSPKNIEIGTPKYIKREYDVLRYPQSLNDNQDTIQFVMYEYGGLKQRADQTSPFRLSKERNFGTITGSVTLPIQTGIKDSNGVEWGVGNMNPLQALGFNILGIADNSNVLSNLQNIIGNLQDNKSDILKDATDALKIAAFQEALQVQGLLARTSGAIINPNVELLFRAPQLRGFGFSFFLAARSRPEANQIKKIIRFFKQGMSVKESTNDIFLKSPNVFQIKYLNGKKGKHEGLNKIKKCALKSFNVDYNPDGSYMTFEDGTMTAYRITMQFQELLPITETDYDGLSDTAIGY